MIKLDSTRQYWRFNLKSLFITYFVNYCALDFFDFSRGSLSPRPEQASDPRFEISKLPQVVLTVLTDQCMEPQTRSMGPRLALILIRGGQSHKISTRQHGLRLLLLTFSLNTFTQAVARTKEQHSEMGRGDF